MRKLKSKLVLPLLAIGLIFASCSNEENTELVDAQNTVPQDVLNQISAFVLNTNDVIAIDEVEGPAGTVIPAGYMVEGDIFISNDQVANLEAITEANGITTEQYRTNNLVSQPRTISVTGWTGGGGFALSNNMRTGLQFAINNYNRLNLSLNFVLSFNTNINADIVVFRQPSNSGSGGSAGFPTGGNPFNRVQIFTGLDNANPNVNEHVAGHEIGHAVGLRHTDWFSRQSCGQSGESAGSIGAILIPGTPSGFDPTSLMLACFSFGTDGEFNANDITALNFLY